MCDYQRLQMLHMLVVPSRLFAESLPSFGQRNQWRSRFDDPAVQTRFREIKERLQEQAKAERRLQEHRISIQELEAHNTSGLGMFLRAKMCGLLPDDAIIYKERLEPEGRFIVVTLVSMSFDRVPEDRDPPMFSGVLEQAIDYPIGFPHGEPAGEGR
jgi:hypothetical protein